MAAAIQAVDGVALKVMVDRWAVAEGEAGDVNFEAALAVRQIEIELAGALMWRLAPQLNGAGPASTGRP